MSQKTKTTEYTTGYQWKIREYPDANGKIWCELYRVLPDGTSYQWEGNAMSEATLEELVATITAYLGSIK